MSQRDFFGSPDPVHALAGTLRAGPAQGVKLSKEQKQFNKLVQEAEHLRVALAHWRDCVPALLNRVATEIEPMVARYREQRVQLVKLLHAAVEGKELSRRQKSKAAEILRARLSELLADGPDDDLIALYDQYAEFTFEEEQAMDAELMRDMAGTVSQSGD